MTLHREFPEIVMESLYEWMMMVCILFVSPKNFTPHIVIVSVRLVISNLV